MVRAWVLHKSYAGLLFSVPHDRLNAQVRLRILKGAGK